MSVVYVHAITTNKYQ